MPESLTSPVAAQFDDWSNTPMVQQTVDDALHGADDGELYLQFKQSESLTLADGRLKNSSFNESRGFGLRVASDELVGYAHSNELTLEALGRASRAAILGKKSASGSWDVSPEPNAAPRYNADQVIEQITYDAKVELLQAVDAYVRGKDPHVVQVNASVNASWEAVNLLRPGGERYHDVRPMVRFSIQVVARKNGNTGNGNSGGGGRYSLKELLAEATWKRYADLALRQAVVNTDAADAPAGQMTVVLGNGWPGVMLHEAVGHGLEGDAIRKGQSNFSNLLGEQVAAKGVTVVDDGTLPNRRGSLTIDDEGTPTRRNVLIEDGVLVGFMQDRLNARLMGVEPTGNGRRESFAHVSMPRMTNTFMLNGKHERDEIIESVQDGIYAVNFGGGQVDIASGDFVFSCTEAYRIRNGVIAEPVRGASLIGNGPEVMRRVDMIGNDLELDEGVAMCGKAGQNIPVGVGQPTLRIAEITVGGTG